MINVIFSFSIFFFNFLFVLVRVLLFYCFLFCFYIFKVLINLPFYALFLIKNFLFLIFSLFKRLCNVILFKLLTRFSYFFSFYLKEGWGHLFLIHFKTVFKNLNTVLKWIDFYRILLKVVPNFSIFLKVFLMIETHSSLLGDAFQSLEKLLEKSRNLYEGRTLRAYRFRLVRRIIKFTLGLVTLIYPIGYMVKMGLFRFAKFLFFIFSELQDREMLSHKNSIYFLKFIIWFKLIFVWKSLPFEILFDYGYSKKYPMFEDVQPDLKTIPSDIWDYALDRYCYFDEGRVFNKFYIFHIFKKPVRYLTSLLGACFILPYLFFKNIYIYISTILVIIYLPVIFFWLHAPITVFFYAFKLPITFIYFIPIFFMFLISVIIFVFYKLILTTYKRQLSFKFLNFIKLNIPVFAVFPNILQVRVVFNFLIFKLKKLTYYKNNEFAKYLFSLNYLLKIDKVLEKLILKFSSNGYKNNNIIGYNSAYVFKRIRSYTLRFKNFQFIKNFLKSYNTYRLTPDQIKAFNKIALNNYYPVYYFEKLFYTVYSKGEQESETPYYWAFMRQAFSSNQDILSPRFHVYGFFNFLNFFWNYFSFLNNKSFINSNLLDLSEFMQLFNSSYGRVFSYLINDLLTLTKTKKFFFYLSSKSSFLRIYTEGNFTLLYVLPKKYYDVLINFFWYYFEPPLLRFLFIFGLYAGDNSRSIRIYNILHEHVSYSWYTLMWKALTGFDVYMNKIFYTTLNIERFYENNFEWARRKYEDFVWDSYKAFFLRNLPFSTYNRALKKSYLRPDVEESLKIYKRRTEFVEYKWQHFFDHAGDFVKESFRFWNYFYQFMVDNVFEFVAVFFEQTWHNGKSAFITAWASKGNRKIFIFFFLKSFILIWLFIVLLIIFSLVYLIKSIFIKFIKLIKKICLN